MSQNYRTIGLTLTTLLALSVCPAANAQEQDPNAIMLHSPIPVRAIDLTTMDPEMHEHLAFDANGDVSTMVAHDTISTNNVNVNDPSPLWGRNSPKVVYVEGAFGGHYYSVVPTGMHYVNGHQSRSVELYQRAAGDDQWVQAWTYTWSTAGSDDFPATRRAFQPASVIVTDDWGNQNERLLHVVFPGYKDIAGGSSSDLQTHHFMFTIDEFDGDLVSTTPVSEDLSTLTTKFVRVSAAATQYNQFLYVAGPDFGPNSVKEQYFKLLRYTPSSNKWQEPSDFQNFIPAQLTTPSLETLQYPTVAAIGNYVWIAGSIYDWNTSVKEYKGVELIMASSNGSTINQDILVTGVNIDIYYKVDMVVTRTGTGPLTNRVFLVVLARHDQPVKDSLFLMVYDQTTTGSLTLISQQPIPDLGTDSGYATENVGSLYYDDTTNALYFLSHRGTATGPNEQGRQLAIWRTFDLGATWDIEARAVSDPSLVSGWPGDWRRFEYVQCLTRKAGGDLPSDGLHAVATYHLKNWISTYNDFVRDQSDRTDWTKNDTWVSGPGKVSWDARGVWDLNIDVLDEPCSTCP